MIPSWNSPFLGDMLDYSECKSQVIFRRRDPTLPPIFGARLDNAFDWLISRVTIFTPISGHVFAELLVDDNCMDCMENFLMGIH